MLILLFQGAVAPISSAIMSIYNSLYLTLCLSTLRLFGLQNIKEAYSTGLYKALVPMMKTVITPLGELTMLLPAGLDFSKWDTARVSLYVKSIEGLAKGYKMSLITYLEQHGVHGEKIRVLLDDSGLMVETNRDDRRMTPDLYYMLYLLLVRKGKFKFMLIGYVITQTPKELRLRNGVLEML